MTWDEDAPDWAEPLVSHDRKPHVDRVWAAIGGLGAHWTLRAALDLGLFDALADGPLDAHQLTRAVGGTDAERVAFCCDALVGMGLLDAITPAEGVATDGAGDRCGDEPPRWQLNLTSRVLLQSGSERWMGDLVRASPGPAENWAALADTIRGADPPRHVDADGGVWHATFAPTAFPTQLRQARLSSVALGLHERWQGRVLDLGAGAAPWTIGWLEAAPRATAVVNDLPAVIGVAAEHLDRHGMTDRATLLAGDYHDVDLQAGAFDLVALANVIRTEGPTRATALLRRVTAALVPGGRAVVVDYLLDDRRHAPTGGLLLGMTMLAATGRGRTWRADDVAGWMRDAGMRDVRLVESVRWNTFLVGRRP